MPWNAVNRVSRPGATIVTPGRAVPLEVEPMHIPEIRIAETVKDGRTVWKLGGLK
jgi:hypothetical protein